MTSMMFLIYFSSVGVSIALRRQARRHREETEMEYERRGIVPRSTRPKVQMPGALACIVTGAVIGAPAAGAFIEIVRDARLREALAPETLDYCCFLFAAGLTLFSAGCTSFRLNRKFRGCAPGEMPGETGISSSPPCSGESASEHPRHSTPPAG
jgi:hypothetical protein